MSLRSSSGRIHTGRRHLRDFAPTPNPTRSRMSLLNTQIISANTQIRRLPETVKQSGGSTIQTRRRLSLFPENLGASLHAFAPCSFLWLLFVTFVTSPYQTLQMRIFYEPYTFCVTEDFSFTFLQHERTVGTHTFALPPFVPTQIHYPLPNACQAANAEQGQHLSSPPH